MQPTPLRSFDGFPQIPGPAVPPSIGDSPAPRATPLDTLTIALNDRVIVLKFRLQEILAAL